MTERGSRIGRGGPWIYPTGSSATPVEPYFAAIESEVDRAYVVAKRARREGFDPETHPEIPRAQDMAMRVEKLLAHLGVEGISTEIRALAEKVPREEVAVAITRRLAMDTSRGGTVTARVDTALRVGLAILTEGILVAPLEGLAEVHLPEGPDGPYIELYYAGPIRAAGGTAQALSVLLADIVRRDLGLAAFHPDRQEVERYQEEIPLYRVPPTPPVRTDRPRDRAGGEQRPGRDIGGGDRGGRGGQRLPKSPPRPDERDPGRSLPGHRRRSLPEGREDSEDRGQARPRGLGVPLGAGPPYRRRRGESYPKYLQDSVGGRPVLAHPGHPGGFRLVYGRSRTTGLAACAVNPATMVILQHFVAIGTQVKLEYPGKAAAMAACDTIEGPIVELADGTVTAVHEAGRAAELLPYVRHIVDLGEILVSYGEFLENNHALVPGAVLDRLAHRRARRGGRRRGGSRAADVRRGGRDLPPVPGPAPPPVAAVLARPRPGGDPALSERVEATGRWVDGALEFPTDPAWHDVLIRLGFLMGPAPGERWRGEPDASAALLGGLGLEPSEGPLLRRASLDPVGADPLAVREPLAGVAVRARGPSRVGGRVGRPEKAYQRAMEPNVHALFPVGPAGGPTRSVPEAARRSLRETVRVDLGVRVCPRCQRSSVWTRCACGTHTDPDGRTISEALPVARIWSEALSRLRLTHAPVVKGVKGLTSPGKVPEPIEKGILRASHQISVYQDGTARFDLTDLPLTHFRPNEVGTPIERLRRLGYTHDWTGAELVDGEQLLELRPQDILLARTGGST